MQVEGSEALDEPNKTHAPNATTPDTRSSHLRIRCTSPHRICERRAGIFQNAPLLKFKAYPRSEDVRFLIQQLALARKIYNTEIQLPQVTLETPSIFNRGSVPFSTEKTRITRLPTDWVYDATSKSILMLLWLILKVISRIEFVKYHIETDDFRVLYTFAKNTKAHRITRRASTLYYILTSEGITQDGSAATGPRHSDKTGYAYDSRAEGTLPLRFTSTTAQETRSQNVSTRITPIHRNWVSTIGQALKIRT